MNLFVSIIQYLWYMMYDDLNHIGFGRAEILSLYILAPFRKLFIW